MSRPVNPNYAVRTWATDPNYFPGGEPWNGQPTKTEPPAPTFGFVPDTGVAASEVNILFYDAFTQDEEGEAYAVEILDHVGQVAALGHWITSNAANVDLVRYSPDKRTWYGASLSSADKFQRTVDWTTWPNTTEITGAGLITGAAFGDFDVDGSGNLVVFCNSIASYVEYNAGTSTWTRRATIGVAPSASGAPHATNVRYVPGLAKWVVAFGIGLSGAPKVWYGTDRATWTGPISSPLPAGAEVRLGCDGANTLVMMGRVSGDTNLYLSKSTDGGATWSSLVTIATGLAANFALAQADPVWTGSCWLVVASTTPGAPASKVYKSTDGLTWTLACSLANTMIKAWAADGEALLGATSAGELVLSANQGATWRFLDRSFAAVTANTDYVSHNGIRFVLSGGGGMRANASGTGLGGAVAT